MSKQKYKISTITMTTRFPDCSINLFNVGKFLEIDETICGIKYNQGEFNILKGSYLTTIYRKAKLKKKAKVNNILFYNQISLIVHIEDSNVNVKLFGNGCLHMTGCKSPDMGFKVSTIIYNRLVELKTKSSFIVLSKDSNGALLDKDNLFYSNSNYQIIGYYNKEKTAYCINKKEYLFDRDNTLIHSKMEAKRTRHLINFNGDVIGNCRVKLLKNNNKFFKNPNIHYDYTNNLIYYNNEKVIGILEYTFDESKQQEHKDIEDVLIIKYSCNPFIPKDYVLPELNYKTLDVNVNCINVYFKLDLDINRQRLYDILLNQNFICKYKPETYSGIKLIYKQSIDGLSNGGRCNCSSKCTCLDVVFLIFQSGNVIVSGFKSMESIGIIIDDFINIIYPFNEIFKKRDVIY